MGLGHQCQPRDAVRLLWCGSPWVLGKDGGDVIRLLRGGERGDLQPRRSRDREQSRLFPVLQTQRESCRRSGSKAKGRGGLCSCRSMAEAHRAAPSSAASLPPLCCPALPAAGDCPPHRCSGADPFARGFGVREFKNQTETSLHSQAYHHGDGSGSGTQRRFQAWPRRPAEGLAREGGVSVGGAGAGPCLWPMATLRPLPRLATVIRARWPGRGGAWGAGAEIRCYQAVHTRIPLVSEDAGKEKC